MKRYGSSLYSSKTKRRRTTSVSRPSTTRRVRRTRRRTRKFKRFRGGKPYANRSFKHGNLGKSIAKHIYIPGTKRLPKFATNVMRVIGDQHHMRYQYRFKSSGTIEGNPFSLIVGLPVRDGTVATGSLAATPNTWGVVSWGSSSVTYPNYEKIFLHYLKIRINIDQYQENCKYRICLARMKKSLSLTQGLSARSGWDGDVSRPSTNTGWNVLWEHAGVLDEPVNINPTTGLVETKNLRQKTIDLFIPINRVLQTATMQPATSEAAWYQGTTTADFTYLHVDTDDATDVDSEYLTFNVFYEYKFTSIS